ncbi:N-acetyl sugar amidotransferase [Desulfovibrio sp. JC010]|uniref:N-acetyl sugar amidotransferase n=1 Tax=Desulfovibrio sp. JC010 TaxID=2593641 RepID=UPI0013D6769F|nr:N-acetyl sugar amidotransferase [Desulfovibrio sp. JC010]NDV27184.1 N-acetyl sugar amidotransferase [Desulfovibrio sp. JC010]
MKYCSKCLMPSTKPYIVFDDEGVCSACKVAAEEKQSVDGIDWDARKAELDELVAKIKAKKAPFFDVLVPVSGGKDSMTQVHRMLEYDLRILAVNVDYGIKTEIGIENLKCIPENMGASLQIFRPELKLQKELIRIGYEDFGDPDLLSHTMLHGYPLRVALAFKIPLVFLGENSAFEYGGDDDISGLAQMTRKWFSKYAANSGHDAAFISKEYNIPMEKLVNYDFPDEIEESDIVTAFSSYYFYWDSEAHREIAKEYGFKELSEPREGTYRTYVGIDEKINRIHQYFKVLKFGYGRGTDHACEDIRLGTLSRDEAKELVRKYDLEPLSDEYVNDFCEFIGISRERFFEVVESYRDTNIWKKDESGNWYIPGHLED